MIGEIVAEDYRTTKVFEDHQIDFCCGGKVALSTNCMETMIDLHKHVYLENNILFLKVGLHHRISNHLDRK